MAKKRYGRTTNPVRPTSDSGRGGRTGSEDRNGVTYYPDGHIPADFQALLDNATAINQGSTNNTHLPNPGSQIDIGGNAKLKDFFNSILSSGGLNDMSDDMYFALLSLLSSYSNSGKGETTERNDMLFQYMLQLLTANDQRNFDISQLQDQRNYNSPTNTLARIMGAGISRDAAIQMLSGSAGNVGGAGSVIGSGANSSAPSVSAPSGTVANQTTNTVFNGIQMVANLVGQGVNLATAINQAQMATAQNYMTQQQLQSYKGVNNIADSFNSAVLDGTLSAADVQGLRSADDYYKYMLDHQDTNLVKPLIANGSFKSVFGSSVGRDMFNKHLEQTRLAKDSGALFDNYVRQTEAAARLSVYDADKAYFDVQLAIGELTKQDAEIEKLWNDVSLGNINIQIAGKDLQLKDIETGYARTNWEVFDTVMNKNYDGSPDARKLGTGQRFLAFSQFDKLSRMFSEAFAASGTQERRDKWERFYLDNYDAAQFMAFIKKQMSSNQANALNADLHPNLAALISLYQIGNLTGAFDVISFGTEVGFKAGELGMMAGKLLK